MTRGHKHLWIPDTQVRESVPINHLYWLAYYALDKGPDTIVWAGDHWDMPSLSSYDRPGSRSSEGRRVHKDVSAGHKAMAVVQEIWAHEGWAPRQHFLLGNHEARWHRALGDEPAKFEGRYTDDDPFALAQYGITPHAFLEPVLVDGIRYSHFFPHSGRGAVTQTKRGAPSALAQVQRQMCSATAGHQQGLDVAIVATSDGLRRGLIAGSFYLHDEAYLGPLNHYWRGLIVKHDVRDGEYNLCEVGMSWLEARYRRYAPAGRVIA